MFFTGKIVSTLESSSASLPSTRTTSKPRASRRFARCPAASARTRTSSSTSARAQGGSRGELDGDGRRRDLRSGRALRNGFTEVWSSQQICKRIDIHGKSNGFDVKDRDLFLWGVAVLLGDHFLTLYIVNKILFDAIYCQSDPGVGATYAVPARLEAALVRDWARARIYGSVL